MTALPRGPKYVAGETGTGHLRLERNDGTIEETAVVLTTGSLTDNGDGTSTLTLPEE